MVYRIYVEKREGFRTREEALLDDIQAFLGIKGLRALRLFNRYDLENISAEHFLMSIRRVLSEPQTDATSSVLPGDASALIAVEYLPGQFDQRADSAAQCIQLLFQAERPNVRNARVYCLYGELTAQEIEAVKAYLINPVDSREASLAHPDTLRASFAPPEPVPHISGFTACDDAQLLALHAQYALAMDMDDLRFVQKYFKEELRDPTLTELKVIDTYWSDHCRHTTFFTELTEVAFDHPPAQAAYEEYLALRASLGIEKPVTLMQLATIAAAALKRSGDLTIVDESEEINACTIRVEAEIDGKKEPWLLLFKNETHNHPTEIEPYGGAATCIGGAIRDPLSGRGYVYQAMRVTGAGDPRAPIQDTLEGKLPQRKLVSEAAAGYSAYGNQIGLATGLVDELYHPGYVAKRMEIGAVIACAPRANVRRERPAEGDAVVLIGGRTGRDGCGGATGSSKTHKRGALADCAAEVQKGNAPEERKLQRLFRNPQAARLIKRCNDFGAGGVSVAIGELADGLDIDLDSVPKKYEGLGGTELAISESQERMAVVIDQSQLDRFLDLAAEENVEATPVATVTQTPRLRMRFMGEVIVDIARAFLDTNGAPKKARARVAAPGVYAYPFAEGAIEARMRALVSDLNVCAKRGLIERFDSTIGAGTVLMPLGGVRQLTPAQAMAAKLPVMEGECSDCSVMAYGFNPYISAADPFKGAYLAVVESVAKLVAHGAPPESCTLTFQEYFPRLGRDPARWGLPVSALLGALRAQTGLKLAAIGGKDSMSGSFEQLDVPPTLVSFAVTMAKHDHIRSPEWKKAGNRVALLLPDYDSHGLPTPDSLLHIWKTALALLGGGKAYSAWTPVYGGVAEGLFKMCLGNRIGLSLCAPVETLFRHAYGGLILETDPQAENGLTLGYTTREYVITLNGERLSIDALEDLYTGALEQVYPTRTHVSEGTPAAYRYEGRAKPRALAPIARPRVLIPVFPGTNCEYDSQAAWQRAGAKAEVFVIRNRDAAQITQSVNAFAKALSSSQALFLPGGFSGGDEPDGSAKFIAAFLRNARIADEIEALTQARDGLIGGICNGFQALVKLGLLPGGRMRDMDADCPTLTFNVIGRHQSRLVRTRVASMLSPWLSKTALDALYLVPISHGEGRFVIGEAQLSELAANGQIAAQYVDESGVPTMAVDYNPNGSHAAIEAITSPDGRIFGKMGHTERIGEGLYKNVPGNARMPLFESAVGYFR